MFFHESVLFACGVGSNCSYAIFSRLMDPVTKDLRNMNTLAKVCLREGLF